MSGSTIGGVVGAAIGFWVGGPQGAQIGWMLGSAVGGYLDPTVLKGPRLSDATQQTSRDGIPIAFGAGIFPTTGNVIWQGPLVEHKKKQRQGKGGAVTETYTYTRSYAIGICQGPIDGLLLIKRNGKIIFDARGGAELTQTYSPGSAWSILRTILQRAAAERAKFTNRGTIYLGDEAQLPDPTIEAIEGVGNVAPFRGLAYVVVRDDDVTELQGAIPQYEFVVAVNGTVKRSAELGNVIGQTTLDGHVETVSARAWVDGVLITHSPSTAITYSSGAQITQGVLSAELDGGVLDIYAPTYNAGMDSPATSVTPMAFGPGGYLMVADGNFGTLRLMRGGSTVARLKPTVGALDGWAYGYGSQLYSKQFGNVVAFGDLHVFTLVQLTNGANNVLFKWPLHELYTGVTLPEATYSGVADDPADIFETMLAVESYAFPWILNKGDGTLKQLSAGLVLEATYSPSIDFSTVLAFAVSDGCLFLLRQISFSTIALEQYELGTWAPRGSVSLVGTWPDRNYAVTVTAGFICVQAGKQVVTVEYFGGCLGTLPDGYTALPDVPGFAVSPSGAIVKVDCSVADQVIDRDSPLLANVVAGLLQRAGLETSDYNVSALTEPVYGYRIATEGGADSFLSPLAQAFFFDVAEWDGVLHFVPRGGDAVATVGRDDYLENDDGAIRFERVQEPELLRKVTVGYLDPSTLYTPTTQKAERLAITVQARGESSIEIPLVMPADQAAAVAQKRLNVAWAEAEKAMFGLPVKWSRLTPADVIGVEASDGQVVRARVMGREDDSGRLLFEATREKSNTYVANVTGVLPPPPTYTDGTIIGPTLLAVMDLPVWRESDDALGVYVAVRGLFSGWAGASVQLSSDGGATIASSVDVTAPATVGTTATALQAWSSAEYPSVQSVTVTLPDPPASVDYETLLRYSNRAAVQLDSGAWEILQFQTATSLGAGSYALSGLVRGRYNTTPGAAAAGARFVLLDADVIFVPIEAWMLGRSLSVRAVSAGTEADGVPWTDLTLDGVSQTEWAVTGLIAERDGSNTVTVSWIPRGRIGTETSPQQSRYLSGYRVTFSDGETALVRPDEPGPGYIRAACPVGVTVSVAAINSITGPGPSVSTPT